MQTNPRASGELNLIQDSASTEFWEAIDHITQDVCWQSALHTQYTIPYFQMQSEEAGIHTQDRSFVAMWEDTPHIAFIGSMIERDGVRDLFAHKVPCTLIEDKRQARDKPTKAVIRMFDELVSDINGTVQMRDFLIDGTISSLSEHMLRHGASATPAYSQVINLSQEESRLKSRLRKSYRSLINWGLRELNPRVLTTDDISWEDVLAFRDLHTRVAGRETRTEATWRRQFEAVKRDQGFVVMGYQGEELVTAGLFSHNTCNCYYSSSASRRDLFDKPLFHALMWTAILHARNRGLRWLEMGDQVLLAANDASEIDPKEVSIMDFKAGFGSDKRVSLDLAWNPMDHEHGK